MRYFVSRQLSTDTFSVSNREGVVFLRSLSRIEAKQLVIDLAELIDEKIVAIEAAPPAGLTREPVAQSTGCSFCGGSVNRGMVSDDLTVAICPSCAALVNPKSSASVAPPVEGEARPQLNQRLINAQGQIDYMVTEIAAITGVNVQTPAEAVSTVRDLMHMAERQHTAARSGAGDAPPSSAPPPDVWRCFHCGIVLTTEQRAREHFGPTRHDIPECQIATHPYALNLRRDLFIANRRLAEVRDVLADLTDACYTEGTSPSWRLCGVCQMEHRPDDAMPSDQTHEKNCAVDAAERWLRLYVRERSIDLSAPVSASSVPSATEEATVICERCQMKVPARLATFGIGVRAGKAAWCAACRVPEGPDGQAKRAEVVAMRKARLASVPSASAPPQYIRLDKAVEVVRRRAANGWINSRQAAILIEELQAAASAPQQEER